MSNLSYPERVAQGNANAKLGSILLVLKSIEQKRVFDHQQLEERIATIESKCTELGRLLAERDCACTISNSSATGTELVFSVSDIKVFEEHCLKFVEQFKNCANQDENCKLMAIRYIHFYYFIFLLILLYIHREAFELYQVEENSDVKDDLAITVSHYLRLKRTVKLFKNNIPAEKKRKAYVSETLERKAWLKFLRRVVADLQVINIQYN
jgi:hypothetical protein